MPVSVRIPTPLRTLTKGADEVKVEGKNIKEIIESLEANYKGIKERICDNDGQIRRFVNFYLNDEDIRFIDNINTPVKDGDHISIVPAIARRQLNRGVGGVLSMPSYFNYRHER